MSTNVPDPDGLSLMPDMRMLRHIGRQPNNHLDRGCPINQLAEWQAC
jgi:hypothetical protein